MRVNEFVWFSLFWLKTVLSFRRSFSNNVFCYSYNSSYLYLFFFVYNGKQIKSWRWKAHGIQSPNQSQFSYVRTFMLIHWFCLLLGSFWILLRMRLTVSMKKTNCRDKKLCRHIFECGVFPYKFTMHWWVVRGLIWFFSFFVLTVIYFRPWFIVLWFLKKEVHENKKSNNY